MIDQRQTTAKAFDKDVFIDQERKLGDRRWLDTVVALTINNVDFGLENITWMIFLAQYEKS